SHTYSTIRSAHFRGRANPKAAHVQSLPERVSVSETWRSCRYPYRTVLSPFTATASASSVTSRTRRSCRKTRCARLAEPMFSDAMRGFESLRKSGGVGFVDLPDDRRLLEQVTRFSAAARGSYDDVVILGIGGSALGPVALRTALRPSGWDMLDEKARGGFPRLQVLDNVDPETIAALLDR